MSGGTVLLFSEKRAPPMPFRAFFIHLLTRDVIDSDVMARILIYQLLQANLLLALLQDEYVKV